MIISNVAATVANISWDWDKTWLEEQGKMDDIHGELRGFKVSVDYLPSLVLGSKGGRDCCQYILVLELELARRARKD